MSVSRSPRAAPRFLVLCAFAGHAGASACSDDDRAPAGDAVADAGHPDAADAGVPNDDDTARLAHCGFTPLDEQPSRGTPPRAAVRAGIASRPLLLPVGVPLGGYGARSTAFGQGGTPVDGRAARWATRFVPSAGVHDVPRVDALALEVGEERLVVLRADVPLITENALFAVERALAADGSLAGRVIVTASHSHAGWAAWQPTVLLAPGIDRPRRDLFDRVVEAFADAGEAALATLEPARVGFAISESLDALDEVSRDRRRDNDAVVGPDGNRAGAGKDPTTWALRVDRSSGEPLGALFSVPIHGTVGGAESPLVSTDAPGGIARALGEALGYPVFHVQGAAGDVEPAGAPGRTACPDAARCLDLPQIEVLGARAAALAAPLVRAITTTESATLEVVTRTFYVGRAGVVRRPDGRALFYPPPTDDGPDGVIFEPDGRLTSPLDEFNAPLGAALCGTLGGTSFAPIPGVTASMGAYSSCLDLGAVAGAFLGVYGFPTLTLPLCDTARTTTTAVRLAGLPGGDALLVTLPGEPTAPLSAYLRGRSPAGARTAIVGYAQDYVGYVLTAEDWLAGGYEPSLNVWGPLEGEVILDGVLATAAAAWSDELEGAAAGGSRFVDFPWPAVPPAPPIVTSTHGIVPTTVPSPFLPDTTEALTGAQPDARVPRAVGAARFAWLGGDPAVDLPEVTVERETTLGRFEPLATRGGTAASSRDGVVVLTYTPEPLDSPAPDRHHWVATWQPVPPDAFALDAPERPFALPTGRYRLTARGTARTARGDAPYTVTSAAFEVEPAPLGTARARRAASALELSARLPRAPGLRALSARAPSDGELPLPGPWLVIVRFDDGSALSRTVTPDDDGTASLPLPAAGVARATSVDVRDGAGNGGTVAVE